MKQRSFVTRSSILIITAFISTLNVSNAFLSTKISKIPVCTSRRTTTPITPRSVANLKPTHINDIAKSQPYTSSSSSSKRRLVSLNQSTTTGDYNNDKKSETNKNTKKRPEWASDWMPTWLITMRPLTQTLVGALMYVFHLAILTQHNLTFPVQLIPNDKGRFQSIGLDSVAGILSLCGLVWLRKNTQDNAVPAVPKLLEEPYYEELPWKIAMMRLGMRKSHEPDEKKRAVAKEEFDNTAGGSLRAAILLLIAYSSTGKFAFMCEGFLYRLAGMGVPLTIAMHRSLVVLLGHLCWVVAGCLILRFELNPNFFTRKVGGGRRWKFWGKGDENGLKSGDGSGAATTVEKSKWYTNTWDTYWLWWVMGGYFVSSWLFNIADFLNQIVLPAAIFEEAGEGVVSQLINPENNDLLASIVGYIAPCCSAPIWEEVLYRGYMLPSLCMHMTFWPAVVLSGFIFSAHHMSTTGFIPLMMLGMTWAALYAKCRNLMVTIIIHAMWNSRVFLGSWLGL